MSTPDTNQEGQSMRRNVDALALGGNLTRDPEFSHRDAVAGYARFVLRQPACCATGAGAWIDDPQYPGWWPSCTRTSPGPSVNAAAPRPTATTSARSPGNWPRDRPCDVARQP
jgi:hypothetical protein